MNKYILASFNKNKLLEISSQLNHIELLSLRDVDYNQEIIESGITLQENALIKARTIYSKFHVACISDDTGLEVFTLDRAPGVFSARYAGPNCSSNDNILKLLNKMKGCHDRRARFRTVICLKSHLEEKFFEGCVNGVISNKKKGDQGFGYDPVFIPDGYDITFAQMSLKEKNKISHRSQAVKKLIQYLNL